MTACGFFGKLPALGDFVSRRIEDDYLECWDDWLQHGIAESREALGGKWVDIYLESPIWRFALPAGYAGRYACCGIMLPSIDRVGRNFPLTLVVTFEAAPTPLLLMNAVAPFFEAAEDLALAALDPESFALQEFDDEVAALAPQVPALPDGATATQRDVAWLFELPFDDALEGNIPALLGKQALTELDGLGLWWTQGSDRVNPCLLVTGVLPLGKGFTPMLDGNWDDGYWQEVALSADTEASDTDSQDTDSQENQML